VLLYLLLRSRVFWRREVADLESFLISSTYKPTARESWRWVFLFMAQTETVKETKAQRVERLKREKNPWEALDEIRGFARTGFNSIPPEWLGTYFRWWGVYTQGDGAGVVGGKGGEGKALP
jgi:hypothetical protein